MIFEELDEFKKDLKSLLKKFKSLNDDLEIVKKILSTFPEERPPFSFRIADLGIEICAIKVKKIACKALKGKGVNSGFRLIYAYFEEMMEIREEDVLIQEAREAKIILVELYHKSNKANEDKERIMRYKG